MADKIALLSNVNLNMVLRMLRSDEELSDALIYAPEGYGNELGLLMDPHSSYHEFAPKMTFVVQDLGELLEHDLTPEAAKSHVTQWFSLFAGTLRPETIYYVSDAYLWGAEVEAAAALTPPGQLEQIWDEALRRLTAEHGNVHILPLHRMIAGMGEENAFSAKMWYMGKIPFSAEAQKRLAKLIRQKVTVQNRVPKKVLALDLDNTLWGGLAGEQDSTPIVLSEDHAGLAYKNLQRVILQLKRQGVILVIVSKNNEEDAMAILQEHPHMVLRPDCFAGMRINWQPKHENIKSLAEELNLGTDSFVFWDDSPTERTLVEQMLPEVTVPEFPDKPEDLAGAMTQIYHTYFEKTAVTEEDRAKTAQYADNAKRQALQNSVASFEDYLKQLQIVVKRVDPAKHAERLTQLVNKTNQFNLTTRRYDAAAMQALIADPAKRIFLYNVADRFGDNGIVAVVIADVGEGNSPGTADITDFVMSCRVMGRNIEFGILEDVVKSLEAEGIGLVCASYLPTAKNKPVENLYDKAGWKRISQSDEGAVFYEMQLAERDIRGFVGEITQDGWTVQVTG